MPKHIVLSDWLRNRILSGDFASGEKVPSENELSAQFGISRQTVRLSIANLENEGLLVRVRGSGTFVNIAPSKFKPKTKNVGVIITYLDDYIFPSIVQGIESVLRQNGYTMSFGITYNKVENEAKALEQMIRTGVDGLIVEATKSALPNPNIGMYKQLQADHTPVVFINGRYDTAGDSYVVLDDVGASRIVCGELLEKGHRKIGGIFKSDDMQGHKRYEGFISTMFEKGLTVQENSILWYTTEDFQYLFDGEFDSVILKRFQDMTAIICYNDQVAVKMMELFKRHHLRVPDDMSIISFDNSSLSVESLYNLTSVIYPSHDIGRLSAEGLLERMEKPSKCIKHKLCAQLCIRNSVRSIK